MRASDFRKPSRLPGNRREHSLTRTPTRQALAVTDGLSNASGRPETVVLDNTQGLWKPGFCCSFFS